MDFFSNLIGGETMKKATSKAKPARSTPDAETTPFAPIVKAFSKTKGVERGGRFGSMSLKSSGKTFAMLVKGKFVIKLPKERVAALVAAGGAEYFDPGHGRLMKEWVAFTRHQDRWIALAREAYAYVTAANKAARGRK